jgi:hypothetical protein
VLNVGFTLAGAAGPATAGLVVAWLGAPAALAGDAASFAVAAAVLPAGLGGGGRAAAGRPSRALRAGLAYVAGRPELRALLATQALALVSFTAVLPVEVVLAKGTLGAGDAGYGALLASWGAGMVAGGAVFAAAPRVALKAMLVVGTAAVAAGYAGMGAAPGIAAACAGAALGGAGNGVQWVALVSAVQGLTSQPFQARVMSLLESVSAAAPAVGFVLGGLLAAAASPRATFVAAAAGSALATVAFAAAGRPASGGITAWTSKPGAAPR